MKKFLLILAGFLSLLYSCDMNSNYEKDLKSVDILSSLAISSGTIDPGFSAATTTYKVSVDNDLESITVTPTAANPSHDKIEVQMNGGAWETVPSGSPSSSLALGFGANTLKVKVTAQDGTSTNTYTVTVNRTLSSEASLSGLTLSSGPLSFSPGKTTYYVDIDSSIQSITVTPVATYPKCKKIEVLLNDVSMGTVVSGSVSTNLAMGCTPNTLKVKVTAQDGTTTKIYTLAVNRGCSSDPTLSVFTFTGPGCLFDFNWYPGIQTYAVSISTGSALTIKATNKYASITINYDGTPYPVGPSFSFPLFYPPYNFLYVTVVSQDGNYSKLYTIIFAK